MQGSADASHDSRPTVTTASGSQREAAEVLRRRQAIFRLLNTAEKNAMAVADQRYPEPPVGTPVDQVYLRRAEQHDTIFTNERQGLFDKIGERFGLSQDGLVKIRIEGNRARWPK
jgi:hypothetical protein